MKKSVYSNAAGIVLAFFMLCQLAQAVPDAAEKAYLLGDYNETIRLCLASIEEKSSDDTLYFLGLSFFKLGEYAQARDYFRKLLQEFKTSSFYGSALVKLVDTYFLEGRYDKAQALYESILEKYPRLDYFPLIYLRLAQLAAKKGDWNSKHKYIRFLRTNYRESLEYTLAKRLLARGDFFTVQVGAFSRKANAANFLKKLKAKYPAYIAEETEDDLILYKVRIGKYPVRTQAEYVSKQLLNDGYPARIYP